MPYCMCPYCHTKIHGPSNDCGVCPSCHKYIHPEWYYKDSSFTGTVSENVVGKTQAKIVKVVPSIVQKSIVNDIVKRMLEKHGIK